MTTALDTCGCCEPPAPPTPETVDNRPGLSAVRYRAGTYASFREAMIERAAHEPALGGWTARTDDDYGMSLVDLWAYVADILTFYQERIANEAFLRTALLRDSVVHLAGLLGYVPAPGQAAATQLAFTLDKGKALTVPAGLKVQSVPGPGETPQKFETSADLAADASLNSVPVVGTPEPPWPDPLGETSRGATLEPSSADDLRRRLTPGDRLVAYGAFQGTVEEKRLVSIERAGFATTISWTPPILDDAGRSKLTKFRRTLRLFGHDAPDTYLKPEFDSTTGEVTLSQWTTPTTLGSRTKLQLDAVYDDLPVGTRLLAPSESDGESVVAAVTAVRVTPTSFGPLNGTVTEIELSAPVPGGTEPRKLELYELDDVDIDLWANEYPSTIEGTRVLIPLMLGVSVDAERAIVLNDAGGPPHAATVTAVGTTSDGLHLAVDFTPGLPSGRALDAASATLAGNVVEATHGETVARERLGSGDASIPFQRFPLAKSPVTYVRSPGAPHGVVSTLDLRVAGVRWQPADNLYGHGASERVYTQTVGDDGKTTIEFGDGVTGSRPPTGAEVMAIYRKGIGKDGNVAAGTLISLLTKPVGLRAATNPDKADGGAEPETLAGARQSAPQTVRTFGRIVSLRDFEDAARESASVAKALATIVYTNGEQSVQLTVAGEDGDPLSELSISDLQADLDTRRDPFRPLTIVGYTRVPVHVEAVVIAYDTARQDADVQAAAQQALLDHFDFSAREFGQPVHLSEVFAALQSATGVLGVDVNVFGYAHGRQAASHGAGSEAVLEHMRIDADEIATLAAVDAVVTVA